MSYELTVERVIEAPAEVVFDAFTDADAQRAWMQDPDDPGATFAWVAPGSSRGGPAATSCTGRPTCSRWSTGPAAW